LNSSSESSASVPDFKLDLALLCHVEHLYTYPDGHQYRQHIKHPKLPSLDAPVSARRTLAGRRRARAGISSCPRGCVQGRPPEGFGLCIYGFQSAPWAEHGRNSGRSIAASVSQEVFWTAPYRVLWTGPGPTHSDRGRGHPPPLNTPSVFKRKQCGVF
jgi:hypothetical protein